MLGALIAYPLIFVVGYLLLLQFKKSTPLIETILLSFLLGTANVIFVLVIFGISGHLDFGVYSLVVEIVCLVVVLQRKGPISKLRTLNIRMERSWIEASIILLIAIGLVVRFYLLWTYTPNIAWDALKFYLPWTKQLFQQNAIPNFDLSFNAGEPLGHSISFVIIGYLLYFFNGGANEILVYTISPVYALMTTLLVYLFVYKLLNDKKPAYIAAAVFAFVPLNVFAGSVPYVESMLSFFVLAFFLFIDSPNIAGLAAALAILTKYSGFILPLVLIGYLLWKHKVKAIVSSVIIVSLFTVPWYVRNILLYGNPLPFMAFSVRIFEHPPESLIMLWRNWQIQLFNPIGNFVDFLLNGEIPAVLARLVFLAYIPYAVLKKRATSFGVVSFLTLLLVFLISGERDARYLLPFFPLVLAAFMDIMGSIDLKIRNFWGVTLFDVLMIFFSMTFLAGNAVSYLFDSYVLLVLVLWVSLMTILWWTLSIKHWRFSISVKYVIVAGLVSLIAFSFMSQSYEPLITVKEQLPNWQSGMLDMMDYIKRLPDKNEHHFLTVEDPGIRYYTGISSYELTDTYGSIRLVDLFDKPGAHSVFFGADARRVATQTAGTVVEDKFQNINNVEATVNNVTFRFSGLGNTEYSLIIYYKGSGFIRNGESLQASNETWSVFSNIVTVNGSDYTLALDRGTWLVLRFVLLVPSSVFSSNYVAWLRTVLKGHDIKYIILSHTLSQVWVYDYYSIFAYLYMQEANTLFERIYTSEYWELFKLK